DFASLAARVWARVEKRLQAYHIIAEPYRADIAAFSTRDIDSAPLDLDVVAQTTRADNAPMVALELRCPKATPGALLCDQIESALSQGLAVFSLPGVFNLGSGGNLASPPSSTGSDPAAVTSDGVLTSDARAARLVLHAVRALQPVLASSDSIGARPWISRAGRPAVRGVSVDGVPQTAVRVRRQWECAALAAREGSLAHKGDSGAGGDGTAAAGTQLGVATFVDGRSLPASNKQEIALMFTLADAPVLGKGGSSFALTATLGPRRRGVFAANILVGEHTGGDPLVLVGATKEIYARVALGAGSEAWICAEEAVQAGQLLFHGECQVSGHADVELVDIEHAKAQRFSFVAPKPGQGIASISAGQATVHIVFVSQSALDTLVVGYSSSSRETANGGRGYTAHNQAATVAAWGVEGLAADACGGIDILASGAGPDSPIVAVARSQPRPASDSLMPADGLSADVHAAYGEHPFVWRFSAGGSSSAIAVVSGFEQRTTCWDDLPWKLLPTLADLETMDQVNIMAWQRDLGTFAYQATDIGYNGSHVLYRCQLRLKPRHVTAHAIKLQLNARHRCTVWVNGINMSGHQTLHRRVAAPGTIAACIESLRAPGASAGADRWGGTVTYDVTRAM
ncbi:hypothetical protein H4R19_005701, partial [Coemansia spiralis]